MPEVEIADRWTGSEAGEPPFSRGQALPGYSPDFKANEAVWGWVKEEGPGICVWEARPCYSRGSNFLSGLPSRSGEVKRRLPDGPAIKSRRAPVILPDQFRLQRKCTFHLGFSLVYGRRSELDEQPDLARQRGSLLSGDAELMSFDRLLDPQYIDTRMKDAVTVRATGDGRYHAEYVPPVFSLGPVLAERLLVIDGWEEAIEKNPDISNERKMFLQRRIPYWKEWASLRPQGIYRPVDRE